MAGNLRAVVSAWVALGSFQLMSADPSPVPDAPALAPPPPIPARCPVLPLRDVVVFPYVVMPLMVGRKASLSAIEAATRGDGTIFLVAQRNPSVDDPAAADLFRIGVTARIHQVVPQPNGAMKVLVEGIGRARAARYSPHGGHLRVTLALEPESAEDESTLHALARRAIVHFEE